MTETAEKLSASTAATPAAARKKSADYVRGVFFDDGAKFLEDRRDVRFRIIPRSSRHLEISGTRCSALCDTSA